MQFKDLCNAEWQQVHVFGDVSSFWPQTEAEKNSVWCLQGVQSKSNLPSKSTLNKSPGLVLRRPVKQSYPPLLLRNKTEFFPLLLCVFTLLMKPDMTAQHLWPQLPPLLTLWHQGRQIVRSPLHGSAPDDGQSCPPCEEHLLTPGKHYFWWNACRMFQIDF